MIVPYRPLADRAGVDAAAGARGAGMTEQTTTRPAGLLARILDYANRANPYPLYAELRKTPVFRAPNGSYVVSTYREIMALMHDPRVGVGGFGAGGGRRRRRAAGGGSRAVAASSGWTRPRTTGCGAWPRATSSRPKRCGPTCCSTATDLIDRMRGKQQIDLVDDFAYPLPVTVICRQLGVPHEDEPRFHPWAEAIITAARPAARAAGRPPPRPPRR